ncbi:MAG: prenyltransferase, partial [Bacteroidales bacterium]
GWWLIGVGVAVAIFALAYSAGPFPLSYNGLGDVAVIIFFGIVPVNMTYYLMVGEFSVDSLLCSVAIGLLASNVLIVNNYRDMEDDIDAKKRTTVVIFGRKTMGRAYLISGYAAMVLYIWELPFDIIVTPISAIIYITLHTLTWMKLIRLRGATLNKILGETARNMLIFTLTIPVIWLIIHLIYRIIPS